MASPHEDCLFCRLYREGDHVASTKGLVAIKDINPQAPVHLLVIPERHVGTFRDVQALVDGASPGKAATETDLEQWSTAHTTPFTELLDPTRRG